VLLNCHIGLLFCKDGEFSVSVNLWCVVVCVWCDVDITPNTHHYTPQIYTNAKSSVFTEQNDRCGNSTAQSQAPDDGYINIRNMLST